MDFGKIALEEAQKSKCNKRKVGAILVVDGNKIIGKGHNYNPTTSEGDRCEDTDGNTFGHIVHAEIATLDSIATTIDPWDINESTMYVTHKPCENCQKALDEHDIKVIIVEEFMKFDTGKLMYSLIPPVATRELAKVLTYGAKKYKPNNWQGVDDTGRYVDALYRHLEAWRSGEKVDAESKLSHLSHALTNVSFLLHFEEIQSD